MAVIKTRMMGDHVGLYVTALLSHCCYIAVAVIKTRMMGDHVGLYKSSFECVMSTCRGEGVRLPHHRYLTVTLPLHRCYTPSLRSGDGCLLRTTRPLHDRYSTVHTKVTLPFYCCYIPLLLHFCCIRSSRSGEGCSRRTCGWGRTSCSPSHCTSASASPSAWATCDGLSHL